MEAVRNTFYPLNDSSASSVAAHPSSKNCTKICGTFHDYYKNGSIKTSNLVLAHQLTPGTPHSMQPDEDTKLIRLLLARLERVSVDSYWAHRASGIRGALLRTLEDLEKGTSIGQVNIGELISSAFIILTRAAREKR